MDAGTCMQMQTSKRFQRFLFELLVYNHIPMTADKMLCHILKETRQAHSVNKPSLCKYGNLKLNNIKMFKKDVKR